ncbi:biotin-dependent carboxyltransferase family protein [Neptuniibacter sp. QD29_5]|uniref:5-oxoprolinase subunit C family protein n=1 Tax=Neptuniibacter sp. QD29_5 TaxID=3398207 RepID=UPI0039F50845
MSETGFKVLQPGLLTLIQDAGRFGHHRIGLTTGGPLDAQAFKWANRLLGNDLNSSLLEVSVGGLVLESHVDTYMVVTGADIPFKVNGLERECWHAQKIQQGDRIELGFATKGARAYLAVSGGFQVEHNFSSSATVMREGVGGIDGGKLQQYDFLYCTEVKEAKAYRLAEHHRPQYDEYACLRVICGYQQHLFSEHDKRIFFSSEYEVTDRADRMGYRLSGPEVKASVDGILSEGICHGAIQIPADGQPIVLLNDRQTIGGYPKIGSMLSFDTAKMAQMMPGAKVSFEQITIDDAHNIQSLTQKKFERTEPDKVN